jgi:hypothetical protein
MIHHYTSIHNLALILKSKKIRFTRMDLVDDLTENEGLPSALEKVAYISCWTDDSVENIALWNMYTPDMRGVKITLPEHPFKKYVHLRGDYPGVAKLAFDIHAPFTLEEMYTERYIMVYPFDTKNYGEEVSWFYKRVVYRDDYSEVYKKILSYNEETKVAVLDGISEIGRFKSTQWAFQRESRYTIYCHTYLPLDHPTINGDRDKQFKSIYLKLSDPDNPIVKDFYDLEWIDAPLDEDYLNNIEVTLGPNCSVADRIIVEALLKEYVANGTIRLSPLTGRIRHK